MTCGLFTLMKLLVPATRNSPLLRLVLIVFLTEFIAIFFLACFIDLICGDGANLICGEGACIIKRGE